MNLNLALCLTILPLIAAVSLHLGEGLPVRVSPFLGTQPPLSSHVRSLILGRALGYRDVRVWQHELDELWDLGEAACQQVDELESWHHEEYKGLPIRLNETASGTENVLLKYFITRHVQSYFLAVNMAESEGKTDFYLLMFGNSSFSIGEYYVTNVPDFFFCGNIALCKWHTSNPIECNKMKQSVPSSMGLIYTMLMNP